MAQDKAALGKYREGKTNLDQLLRERNELLESLEVLVEQARDLTTSDTIVKFDVAKSQDLCTTLKDVETRIDALIADINVHAGKCGEQPIKVQTVDS